MKAILILAPHINNFQNVAYDPQIIFSRLQFLAIIKKLQSMDDVTGLESIC